MKTSALLLAGALISSVAALPIGSEAATISVPHPDRPIVSETVINRRGGPGPHVAEMKNKEEAAAAHHSPAGNKSFDHCKLEEIIKMIKDLAHDEEEAKTMLLANHPDATPDATFDMSKRLAELLKKVKDSVNHKEKRQLLIDPVREVHNGEAANTDEIKHHRSHTDVEERRLGSPCAKPRPPFHHFNSTEHKFIEEDLGRSCVKPRLPVHHFNSTEHKFIEEEKGSAKLEPAALVKPKTEIPGPALNPGAPAEVPGPARNLGAPAENENDKDKDASKATAGGPSTILSKIWQLVSPLHGKKNGKPPAVRQEQH